MKRAKGRPDAGEGRYKERSTQAPGQYYGYSLQTTRMVARLLEIRPGQSVALEVLDDVAVLGTSGEVAEQDKSGLAHNPISNRSPELWKTLSNWLEAIRDGALKADIQFVLYVAQPHKGQSVEMLHAAKNAEEVARVVGELRDAMWGVYPNYAKRAELPDTLAPHVNNVFNANDDVLARLVAAFELVRGSGSPSDDLRPLVAAKAVGETAVDNVINLLLGWTKRRVDNLIETGKAAIISWEDFHKQLVAAARKFDRADVLSPSPTTISESEVDRELKSRVYVDQLRWIECDPRELSGAVNDFLRASIDRTMWSERGDVVEESFVAFAERLERYWHTRRRLATVELAQSSEVEKGQAVFAHSVGANVSLQGLEVPSYFVPGSFHSLAEQLVVGWHPRYRDLSREVRPGDESEREKDPLADRSDQE